MSVIVKDWFIRKNFTQDERYVISVADSVTVAKETEKAVYICYDSKFGKLFKWVPKSCLMTAEDIAAEQARFENGCKAYDKMIAFAKENGVKVRSGMKKATILQKIREAGLEYAC